MTEMDPVEELNIFSLPGDVLLHIFVLVCNENGVQATRIASVCKAWRYVQWDASMWINAFVPKGRRTRRLGDTHVLRLAGSGAWKSLQRLSIEGTFVGEDGFLSISSHCPNLTSLNVGRLKFSPGLFQIATNCSLRSLNLSQMAISEHSLVELLTLVPKLESLKLKDCSNVGSETLDDLYVGSLEELRVLNLNRAGKYDVEINPFMLLVGCPKLEVLKLPGDCRTRFNIKPLSVGRKLLKDFHRATHGLPPKGVRLPGFRNLRELVMGGSRKKHLEAYDNVMWSVSTFVMYCFLRDAEKLESLDITGCKSVHNLLPTLQTSTLKRLYVARSGCATTKGISKTLRWAHSLEVLDCSGSDKVCPRSVQDLTQLRELKILGVGGSTLDIDGVKEIVRNLKGLEKLDTSGCMEMEAKFRHPLGSKALEMTKEEVAREGRDWQGTQTST